MNLVENNKIIISDVDVSGCEYLYKSKKGTWSCDCLGFYFGSGICANNSDCYYKQLQREKQKNKELTEDFNELRKRHDEAFEDFLKLKKKNEQLVKDINVLRKTLKEVEND